MFLENQSVLAREDQKIQIFRPQVEMDAKKPIEAKENNISEGL
jgi:hypothetical protein